MPQSPERPARKSPRLKGYDYAQDGAYFVTICTHNRICLFGEVRNEAMVLNHNGQIVEACWYDLPRHYPNIELDAFIVMPNHVHGIIILRNGVGVGLRPSPTEKIHDLPEIVRALKSFAARRINERRDTPGQVVWQRSFHDRIIRSETEWNALRQYTLSNPAQWEADTFHPD